MSPAVECQICHYKAKTAKEPAPVSQMANLIHETEIHDTKVHPRVKHVDRKGNPIIHWKNYPETPKTEAFNSEDVIIVNG